MPCDLNFQLQQITQPCNFQHDEQIFIHCYFLLLLMPEPLQYICPRFDTRRISQVIATYFKLNLSSSKRVAFIGIAHRAFEEGTFQ